MERLKDRRVVFSLVLFFLVALILLAGRSHLPVILEYMQSFLDSLRANGLGLPALIVIFIVGAFLGIPQFVLIGIAVAVFGPFWGSGYAWASTLTSGSVTYFIGRFGGQNTFRSLGGKFTKRFSKFVERNAFMASMMVRLVPSGPFLVVNMIFGITRASYLQYITGMAIGVIPKTALVAFAGQGFLAAIGGSWGLAIVAVVIALIVWLVMRYLARKRVPEATYTDETQ